ncbi:MOXD1 homolog 2-like [Oppia nitens]|uniref:MOXD1 homolog 2-like n=1 Tax=Oppia nitens TaxID=1686743 RepID=UPI0023DB6E4D|nr:MOXD1 homolog 2-like [Oppia nitens]
MPDRVIADHYNELHRCWKLLAYWAPDDSTNKTILSLPENMGIPINGQNSDEKYLLFEINYKNLHQIKSQFSDTTGFDLYLKQQNGDIDADIVAIGSVPDYRFFVPPKLRHWMTTGNCYKDCIQNHLYDQSLNVLGIVHHSRHRLLKDLNVGVGNNHNNKQMIKTLIKSSAGSSAPVDDNQLTNGYNELNVNFENNDKLIVKCEFNSVNETHTVLGGISDDKVQCIAWLVYYPRIEDFNVCLSSFTLTTIMSITGIEQLEESWSNGNDFDITVMSSNNSTRLDDYLSNKIDWDYKLINRSKYAAQYAKQSAQCSWNRSFLDLII